MDGRTDKQRENSIPLQTKFAGGYNQAFFTFNPYPATILFCPENIVCFLGLLLIFKCRLDCYMETNTRNTDLTAATSKGDKNI